MLNEYTVTVVFGSATGMPTQTPPPPAATKQYRFVAAQTPIDARLRCAGADFNGDGFSDIVIADPAADGGKGRVYVMF
ncbi:FG-GAP repeat protein, partial [Streptomyces caeruleatus]